jgi:hypothetical protein
MIGLIKKNLTDKLIIIFSIVRYFQSNVKIPECENFDFDLSRDINFVS